MEGLDIIFQQCTILLNDNSILCRNSSACPDKGPGPPHDRISVWDTFIDSIIHLTIFKILRDEKFTNYKEGTFRLIKVKVI